MPIHPRGLGRCTRSLLVLLIVLGLSGGRLAAQGPESPLPFVPPAQPSDRPLPINLPTALQLARARPIDIALAEQRIQAGMARLDEAKALWLPSIYLGVDYARHDGQIQAIEGRVFTTSRSSFMLGAGPSLVFSVSDALLAPLAARQTLRARQADHQATLNDSVLAVVDAYFQVQQARGELAASLATLRRAQEVVQKASKLAEGLIPPVEVGRVRVELARRRQAVELARERWETASAELARLLRLPPATLLEPLEAPHLQITVVDPNLAVDELIPVALSSRPELAGRQALVQATLARLRQEKLRPLVPSVLIRGNATNPSRDLSSGIFGGGVNDNLTNFAARNSIDFQLMWELKNLGFANRAAMNERRAENQSALLDLFRTQDLVAAEVVQAHTRAHRAARRILFAEEGVGIALDTAEKNIQGMSQTRRIGTMLSLVFRPLEVVASIQALDQAYRDYYQAVAEANRAQFQLYRAMGHPGQCLAEDQRLAATATPPVVVVPAPAPVPAPPPLPLPAPAVLPQPAPAPVPASAPASPIAQTRFEAPPDGWTTSRVLPPIRSR